VVGGRAMGALYVGGRGVRVCWVVSGSGSNKVVVF
jgi:hypothetical protein